MSGEPNYPKWVKKAAHIFAIIVFFAICIYGMVRAASETPTDMGSIVLGIGGALMGIVGLIGGATFKVKEASGSGFNIKKAKAAFEGFAPWAWVVIGILLIATIVVSSLFWSGTLTV